MPFFKHGKELMEKTFALIVEDTSLLAKVFAHALEAADYQTETIEDGQKAVDRLREIVPDLVLLDLNLPNVSGEDILAEIRADPRLDQTRVLVVSGSGMRSKFVTDKADLVLQKPISYHQLQLLSGRLNRLKSIPNQ